MAEVRDSFVDFQKHRLQLKQSVAKLRASLQHWQAWEIEYEGMKEEILELGPSHTQNAPGSLAKQLGEPGIFAGQNSLLTQHERNQLLVDGKGSLRNSEQVVGLLSRRIEYVQENIKTVSSLLQTAEEKYAASQVLSQPEVRNEEGLPLTEIYEELDEEGNVISSSISEPANRTPQIVEALQKAGVKVPALPMTPTEDEKQPIVAPQDPSVPDFVARTAAASQKTVSMFEDAHLSSSTSSESLDENSRVRPCGPRKRVSFANGTKEEVNHTPKIAPQERPREEIARIIKEIQEKHYADIREAMPPPNYRSAQAAKTFGKKVTQLDKAREKKLKSAKVYQQWKRGFLEQYEEEEEAASISAVTKPVISGEPSSPTMVLPMKMAERAPNSEGDTPSMTAIEDISEKSETPVTNKALDPVIRIDESPEDAALRRQMLQYNMDEVGAVVAELNLDEDHDISEGYSDEEPDDNSSVEEDEDNFGRTKRRVLNDAYLAEMEALQKKLTNIGPDPTTEISPISHDPSKNRQTSNSNPPSGLDKASKPSRKKSVSFADSLDVQQAPPTTTLKPSTPNPQPHLAPNPSTRPVLASVIERPYTASTAPTVAPEPDEFNPGLLQKEVATEYHKMRNRMIQRQGGFMARDDEQAEVPLTEAEGGAKKVSRFKAARLGQV